VRVCQKSLTELAEEPIRFHPRSELARSVLHVGEPTVPGQQKSKAVKGDAPRTRLNEGGGSVDSRRRTENVSRCS